MIRYARTESGVVLYSVGPNGVDDGGLSLDDALAMKPGRRAEQWDLPFRLLDPSLRGATQGVFRDETMGSQIGLDSLEAAGFSVERLCDLGFSDQDLETLDRR